MADSIHIKLPDGSIKEIPKGTTALDVAKSISPRLADAALVAKTNGDLIDLTRPLEKDTDLRILTEKDPEALESLPAFVGASAGGGRARAVSRDQARPRSGDRERILLRLLSSDAVHARGPRKDRKEDAGAGAAEHSLRARVSASRARDWSKFKSEGDFMKCHFIEQFTKPDEKISIYKTGKFLDFCRGPHIPSTGKIKAFKLLNIAGAYWLGDEKNPQLQRIYGTSFFSKKDLDAYLQQHRRGEEARPSRAGQATRSVFHSGTRRAGADFLASQGRHHPQRDGRLDARRSTSSAATRWCTRRT